VKNWVWGKTAEAEGIFKGGDDLMFAGEEIRKNDPMWLNRPTQKALEKKKRGGRAQGWQLFREDNGAGWVNRKKTGPVKTCG